MISLERFKCRVAKKGLLGILFVLSFFLLAGCSGRDVGNALQEVQDQAGNMIDSTDEHVVGVKNGYPAAYPSITYGQAFDGFFSSPTWTYFRADSGEDVVEFTGWCTYKEAEVKARLQFILSKDGKSFSQGALSFNDVPQPDLITSVMICKAFEDYAERHQVTVDDYEDENIMGEGTQTQIGSTQGNSAEYDEVSAEPEGDNDVPNAAYDGPVNPTEATPPGGTEEEEPGQYDGPAENDSEYIIPDSDTRRLTVDEVKALSREERRLAKNEIYARHGRLFQDSELQDYFYGKSWYWGTIEPGDFDESIFSKTEKANIRLLAKYE